MPFLKLSLAQKLSLGIALSLFIAAGTGGLVADWLTERLMQEQAAVQAEASMLHRNISAANPNPGVAGTQPATPQDIADGAARLPEPRQIVRSAGTDLERLTVPLVAIRNVLVAAMAASFVLLLLVAIWAMRPMARSLDRLATSMERMAVDGGGRPAPDSDEIGHMATRLARYTQELERRVAERTVELEAANRKLAALSMTDGLTGLANRRHFDETLAAEWMRARRTGTPLALVLLDVDHFKGYNDRYGHLAGDECLRRLAGALAGRARRPGDLAARYGGEEFALVLPGTGAPDARDMAEAARQAIEDLGIPHESAPAGRVTISAGVAVLHPGAGLSPEDLVRAADEALYRAKRSGRNRVAQADSSDVF